LEHIVDLHTLLEEVQSIDVIHQPTESEITQMSQSLQRKESLVKYSASTTTPTLSVPERLKREVDMYMQSPVLDIDAAPLNWWRVEWKRMPLLAVVARKYLGICATSVPSERMLSLGGHLVSQKRNSLKPKKNKQYDFLAKNLNG